MKMRRIACSVVAVALLLGRPAGAQSAEVAERPVSFGFMLGPYLYTGGLRNGPGGSTGFGAAVEILVPLPSPHLAVRADAALLGFNPTGNICDLIRPCAPDRGPQSVGTFSADIVARLNNRSARWSP